MIALIGLPLPCLADIAEAAVDFNEGRYEAALTTLKPLAMGGDARAQYLVARMYFDGDGVPENRAKALEYFETAAKHGNPAAQCALGTIYYRGKDAPRDPAKAAYWFQRAVEQDFARARPLLAWLYATGAGVPEDAAKAKLLLGQDDWARPHPGDVSDCGWEEPKNAAEISARRFEQAIARHDPEAEFKRGETYYNDDDYEVAAKWFLKAAEHGQVDAQFALGTMYLDAKGVSQDSQQAIVWFEKAAEQWDMIAMGILCKLHEDRDPARTYMYAYLGMIALNPDAPPPDVELSGHLTPTQVAAGIELAKEFLTRYPRPADASTRDRYSFH